MKKQLPTDVIENELSGASAFFQRPAPQLVPEAPAAAVAITPPPVPPVETPLEETQESTQSPSQPVEKERSKEVNKFTSKLVNDPRDPAVNKVGYYFTRKEMDRLDALATKLKPILRDRFNVKMTKNEIIRACLAIGLADWEEKGLTSKLVDLLTSK